MFTVNKFIYLVMHLFISSSCGLGLRIWVTWLLAMYTGARCDQAWPLTRAVATPTSGLVWRHRRATSGLSGYSGTPLLSVAEAGHSSASTVATLLWCRVTIVLGGLRWLFRFVIGWFVEVGVPACATSNNDVSDDVDGGVLQCKPVAAVVATGLRPPDWVRLGSIGTLWLLQIAK